MRSDKQDRMPAITIRPPWAAAVRAGAKLVENRSRPIAEQHIGRQVAVHAGAVWDRAGAIDPRMRTWWWGSGPSASAPLDAVDFGRYFRGIVAVATIADCHQADQDAGDDTTCCRPWGDRLYRDQPAWHIVFTNVVAVDQPVLVRGCLAVPWYLDPAAEAAVRAQLPEVARA